jgi:CMP-N-acetylneuraminic acid synthetase
MNSNGDIYCLIPARGGSKRLKNKNLLPLGGKPLLAHSVEQALAAGVFSRVVVSSEDPRILEAARRAGAEPHVREEGLASDTARVIHVIQALARQEGQFGPEHRAICVLPATSPLRLVEDIREAVAAFRSSDAGILVSVTEADPPVCLGLEMADDGTLSPLVDGGRYLKMRRQEMPASYHPNGAIYIYERQIILNAKDLCDDKTIGYRMPPERSVNLDTAFDFRLAELLLADREMSRA